MSRNLVVTAVVLLVVVLGGWYLLKPKNQTTMVPVSQQEQSPEATSSSPESTSGAAMMETREVKVSATDFAFAPKALSVKKGEKIKVVLTNDGKYPHDLVVDELSLKTKTISPGQTDTVELTASKSGTFAMYCSVGNHRQRGMEGTVSIQ